MESGKKLSICANAWLAFVVFLFPLVMNNIAGAEIHLYGSVDGVQLEVTGNDGRKPVYTDKDTGKPGYFAENTKWQLVAEGSDISEYLLVPPRYMLYREPDQLDDYRAIDSRIYSALLRLGRTENELVPNLDYSDLTQFWSAELLKESIVIFSWVTPESKFWKSSILIPRYIPENPISNFMHRGANRNLYIENVASPHTGFPIITVMKNGVFHKPELSEYPLQAVLSGNDLKLAFQTDTTRKYRSYQRDTLLHIAANYGLLEPVSSILEQKPRWKNKKNRFGETPLFTAIRGGQKEVYECLLKMANASPAGTTSRGKTVLDYILFTGHSELLLDLESPFDWYAGFPRNNRVVIRVDIQSLKTPMDLCILYQRDDCIPIFYPEPEDSLSRLSTTLYFNPEDRSDPFIAILLEACETGMSNLVDRLLAPPDGRDPDILFEGTFPLIAGARSGSPAIAQLLINAGADLDQTDGGGNTAMIVAAFLGNFEYVKVLVQAGANIDAMNEEGMTALHCAILRSHSNIAIYLLENNADPNVLNNEGENPVWLASAVGDREAVQNLLMKGAICNLNEKLALELMEYAFRWDIPEVVDIALGQCLSADFYFHKIFPARWVAAWYGARDVEALLQEKGARMTEPKMNLASESELDKLPEVVSGFLPEYPKDLQIKYGTVKLNVDMVIGPDGSAYFPRVAGLEIPELRHTFYTLMSKWKFTEPKSQGQPVYAKFRIPIILRADPHSEEGAYGSYQEEISKL